MEEKEAVKCSKLFITFLKIGAFTFGGGYAMIPLIRTEVVDKNKWLSNEDIVDIIAVAESTPGPLAINSATFVGCQTAGAKGAAVATIGVVLPSFIIILVLAHFLRQFEELKAIQYAFWGIRIGVLTLIINALLTMAKECPKNILSYTIAGFAFILVAILGVNVIIVLILCALIGIAASKIQFKKMGEHRK
ncbi:MAG: chromate transporter [bacterium]|nr:chromate transporter [bacterium]